MANLRCHDHIYYYVYFTYFDLNILISNKDTERARHGHLQPAPCPGEHAPAGPRTLELGFVDESESGVLTTRPVCMGDCVSVSACGSVGMDVYLCVHMCLCKCVKTFKDNDAFIYFMRSVLIGDPKFLKPKKRRRFRVS